MSERLVWRTVYGKKRVLFVDGVGCGDIYLTGDVEPVYKVRLWRPGKVTDGDPQALVLEEAQAEAVLLEFVEKMRQEDSAG